MKTIKGIIALFILICGCHLATAQEFKLDKGDSSVIVNGTSNLHDWHVKSNTYSGSITFSDLASAEISKLSVSIPAETLESGKKGMDKNTYKALKTDEFKNITFKLKKVNKYTSKDTNTYEVDALGELTIAGTTQTISLTFLMDINTKTIIINGEKRMKMTEFNVEPPSALFGTIKTGDEIFIKFNSTFNKI